MVSSWSSVTSLLGGYQLFCVGSYLDVVTSGLVLVSGYQFAFGSGLPVWYVVTSLVRGYQLVGLLA